MRSYGHRDAGLNTAYSHLHKTSQPVGASELWSGSDRRGNKSRFSSLMEGKAWVGGGRLAENDPNQSACL